MKYKPKKINFPTFTKNETTTNHVIFQIKEDGKV